MAFTTHYGASDMRGETPNWQPLSDLIGEELTHSFMWMYEFTIDDGTIVHAYKHHETRDYIHLGEDGRTFRYRTEYSDRGRRERSAYDELPPAFAVMGALWTWPMLGFPGEAPLDLIVETVGRLHAARAEPKPHVSP